MAGFRKEKLEEEIKRVVADTLLTEIKDPRIGFVTITKVVLSRDYAVADVGFSVIGADAEKKKSLMGLESAAGYFQHVVGRQIKLRNTPRIRFHLDTSIEEGVNMVNMLEKLERGDKID
jgi:ribosome-binding factor A